MIIIFLLLLSLPAIAFEQYQSPSLQYKPMFKAHYQGIGKQRSLESIKRQRDISRCINTASGSYRVTSTKNTETKKTYSYKNCSGRSRVEKIEYDNTGRLKKKIRELEF